MGPYVEKFHIGAVIFPTNGGPVFPPALQRRLGEELTALGFHRGSLREGFAFYLAPGVK